MGGSAFYWAAIPQDHWNVVVPDSNRLSFSLGTGYDITKWLRTELSYYAGLNLRRNIDNGTLDALGQTMDGRYFSYIHGIYATISYKWESLFGGSAEKTYAVPPPDEGGARPAIKVLDPETKASAMSTALRTHNEQGYIK